MIQWPACSDRASKGLYGSATSRPAPCPVGKLPAGTDNGRVIVGDVKSPDRLVPPASDEGRPDRCCTAPKRSGHRFRLGNADHPRATDLSIVGICKVGNSTQPGGIPT